MSVSLSEFFHLRDRVDSQTVLPKGLSSLENDFNLLNKRKLINDYKIIVKALDAAVTKEQERIIPNRYHHNDWRDTNTQSVKRRYEGHLADLEKELLQLEDYQRILTKRGN